MEFQTVNIPLPNSASHDLKIKSPFIITLERKIKNRWLCRCHLSWERQINLKKRILKMKLTEL